ncbi:MAG: hypothetical protein NZ908_00345 [Candidatus Micrarchaeota archaeon]|nr:hypothetical protein [Candidatus Micrarchaeota archaeon]MCX8154638.1 hypothetical protein [Candidatus Micrarchaeota archaeon]
MGSILGSLGTFTMTLIGIVVVYMVLLYVLSRLAKNEEWNQNFKIEFKQLLLSIMIYVSIFGISNAVHQLYSTYSVGTDLFSFISTQLIMMLKNLQFYASHLMLSASMMKMYGEFTNIGYPHGSYGSARLVAFPGIDLLASVTFQIRDIIMIATGGLVVQSVAMDLIRNLALTVVLPIGVILRILPITRQFGNEMIGLSVAMYLILPLMYFVFLNTIAEISDDRGGFMKRFTNQYLGLNSNDVIEPDKIFVNLMNNKSNNGIEQGERTLKDYFDTYYKREIDREIQEKTSTPDEIYRTFEVYMTISLIQSSFVITLPIQFLFMYSLYLYASGFLVFGFGLPGFALAITLTAAKSIRDSLERLV